MTTWQEDCRYDLINLDFLSVILGSVILVLLDALSSSEDVNRKHCIGRHAVPASGRSDINREHCIDRQSRPH